MRTQQSTCPICGALGRSPWWDGWVPGGYHRWVNSINHEPGCPARAAVHAESQNGEWVFALIFYGLATAFIWWLVSWLF